MTRMHLPKIRAQLRRLPASATLQTKRVLIVDDDRNLTRLLSTVMQVAGLGVITASDGETALQLLASEHVDLIILDLRMPRMDGRTFFRELRATGNVTPVLIASAYGARAAQAELGAQGAVEKPFDPDSLLDVVTRLLY
jgi:DNA-binding response OmpR family regulator